MKYLNQKHQKRFEELISRSKTHPEDYERKSLLYIIAGNQDLYQKQDHIYDFVENWINPECLDSENVDFSTSSKALIRLGFNLYNNYADKYTTPADIFCSLDTRNYNLAMKAVNIKFGMTTVEEYEFDGGNTRIENYNHDFTDEDECDMEL